MSRYLLVLISCLFTVGIYAKSNSPSTEKIKEKMIQESIANYSGNCPCPYNTASNGSRCGKRSAYSRAGGYTPLCYSEDISDKMVKAYKERK